MILVAAISTPDGWAIDVIDDRDEAPPEEVCSEHTDRLLDELPNSTAISFYLVPTHPHDPDPFTAETLTEAIADHPDTFAAVLARRQEAVFEWVRPEPEVEPEPERDDANPDGQGEEE